MNNPLVMWTGSKAEREAYLEAMLKRVTEEVSAETVEVREPMTEEDKARLESARRVFEAMRQKARGGK